MKINGKPFMQANKGTPFEFTVYRVQVKGGPVDGHWSLAGNTTVLVISGNRYELDANGDFVYSPEAGIGPN